MRIYLPLTLADLQTDSALTDRDAFAATPALRALAPDEDDEGAEYLAFLAAAEAAIDLGEASRIVAAADATVSNTPVPGVVRVANLQWRDVVSIHIDDLDNPEVLAAIRAAQGGDEDAREHVSAEGLLWYDASERAHVIALLSEL